MVRILCSCRHSKGSDPVGRVECLKQTAALVKWLEEQESEEEDSD